MESKASGGDLRMRLVAAADESDAPRQDGTFVFGGWIAPEEDWRNYFIPAWDEHVWPGRHSSLDMTDSRDAWGGRPEYADRQLDAPSRVIKTSGLSLSAHHDRRR